MDKKIKPDLRKRTRCDGVGIRIRDIFHQLPPDDRPYRLFNNLARCGRDDLDVREQACDTCSAMVCNECRVHLFYQDTQAEFHWRTALWGYVLLDPELRACFPPVDPDGTEHWDNDETYNDLDFGKPTACEMHMTLAQFDHLGEIPGVSDWETLPWAREMSTHANVTWLMEDDLSIEMPGPRTAAYTLAFPDDIFHRIIYEQFNQAVGARKRFLCSLCSNAKAPGGRQCECIFEERVVDRCVCLRCYVDGWIEDNNYRVEAHIRQPAPLDDY